jgi:large subunit ribosomal protein L4e
MPQPTVQIFDAKGSPSGATHPLPAVFSSPIRPDIVQQVHTGVAKNRRQPYSVSEKAGHQTSAESWGTGQYTFTLSRAAYGQLGDFEGTEHENEHNSWICGG